MKMFKLHAESTRYCAEMVSNEHRHKFSGNKRVPDNFVLPEYNKYVYFLLLTSLKQACYFSFHEFEGSFWLFRLH